MPDKNREKHIAFNTHLLFQLFIFSCILCCCIISFIETEYAIVIAFLCFCLLFVFAFMISPMYVVFTADEITIVYLWGVRERIRIKQIRSIDEEGNCFNRYSKLPQYHIAYPVTEKRPFFADGDVPKTRKTKKIMKSLFDD